MRDKVDKLLKTIDELQSSESANELSARRAERELREEKEKALRLERELEGWKNLRMEKGSAMGGGGGGGGSVAGSVLGSIRGKRTFTNDNMQMDGVIEIPKRKSSISRAPSLTKGFI